MPPDLAIAVGRSCGPVHDADPLARAEQLGSVIGDGLGATLDRELVLVIDEMERLDDAPGPARLIETLVRSSPDLLKVVIITRTDLPFSVARLAAEHEVERIGPDALLVAPGLAHDLVRSSWRGDGEPDADLVDEIVDRARGSAGSILAMAAAIESATVAERREVLAKLGEGDESIGLAQSYVLGSLGPDVRQLFDDLAVFGDATLDELVELGHVEAERHTASLIATRLVEFLEEDGGRMTLTRSARHLIEPGRVPPARVADAARAAIERGNTRDALAAAITFGDTGLIETTLTDFGSNVIDDGESQLVLDAISALPGDVARRFEGLAGDAHMALGAWNDAIRSYECQDLAHRRAGHAWRHGLILYLRGNVVGARNVFAEAIENEVDDESAHDLAMLIGYAGSVGWMMGDLETARVHSRQALSIATASGRDAAAAVAHTVAALVAASDGDRLANDAHYVRALQHAERAGDALQVARIRSNQGSRLMEEGDFVGAVAELDQAVRSANLGGFGTVLALALTNRGEVLTKLGRLDEARTDLGTAVDLLQRQTSRMVSYPLVGLGRLFVERGDVEQARAACEQALTMAAKSEDRQIEVAAHLQLARALTVRDPETAAMHARLATHSLESSLDLGEAWSATAVLELRRGNESAAREAAEHAAGLARSRSDRYVLGHAIEVAALVEVDAHQRRAHLEEARDLFEEMGCVLDLARIDLHLAEFDPPEQAAARVTMVAESARRLGARPLAADASAFLSRRTEPNDLISVLVLGSFAILRPDGESVPTSAWQSRKARDLFKMLITRRGRPLTRDQIVERLWPGDDPAKSAGKLSVALTTIRSVLDPEKSRSADHFLQADGDSIRLDPAALNIDVERFLTVSENAIRQNRTNPGLAATALLAAAEAMYTGDVLEDDPYSDWHVPLREEARATYLSVARALADRCVEAGEPHDGIRLLLRLLEREPYDEPAHLDLIRELSAVGRHGDARRRYQHYASRMRELDLEPQPFPAASTAS